MKQIQNLVSMVFINAVFAFNVAGQTCYKEVEKACPPGIEVLCADGTCGYMFLVNGVWHEGFSPEHPTKFGCIRSGTELTTGVIYLPNTYKEMQEVPLETPGSILVGVVKHLDDVECRKEGDCHCENFGLGHPCGLREPGYVVVHSESQWIFDPEGLIVYCAFPEQPPIDPQ